MNMIFSPAVLAYVASETRVGVIHQIQMGADGNVYCTCEAWKYQKLPVNQRTCKHLQAFACQANLPNGMQYFFRSMMAAMAPVAAPKAAPKKAPKARQTATSPNPWTTPLV